MEAHLKQACQLTGALWAALADRQGGQWSLRAAYHLSKSKQNTLRQFLSQESIDVDLVNRLRTEDGRPAVLQLDAKLDFVNLYVFPTSEPTQVLLVGGKHISTTRQDVWRLVAGLISPSSGKMTEEFLADFQPELSYDMPRALKNVLGTFVRAVNPQGAWLAIQRGDLFDISVQVNNGERNLESIPIDSNSLIRRVHQTLTEVAITKQQKEWTDIPSSALKTNTTVWCCFPLLVGQRIIGAVALWRHLEFDPDEWSALRGVARRASPFVEVLVTFSELTGHLQRLGMLNDFVLTISSAQNLDQIARRVFGFLSRSFSTEMISLLVPSADERLMREYTNRDGKFSVQNVALAGHSASALLKGGQALRVGDGARSEIKVYADAQSVVTVPLKYRRQMVGLLSLESLRVNAFSQYDEHLMGVIASYLAGLIEYGRLREEAEARARNLGLIHEVVQQIIGLSNEAEIAQIAADLVAQFFGYELACVLLVNDEGRMPILGIGGSRAYVVRREMELKDVLGLEGIMGRVFKTGTNALVNNTAENKLYKAFPGWRAGSEICVALKDGDRVRGIIDVESSQQNAFSDNDLLAMESLAGVLATVASSADQYERQLETVRQLREAQVELKARMNAQQDAERKLLQAAKLAAVGEMAAGIAHELNNPLTTVTGFTELILDETAKDAPHREDVELVLKEAKRARDVVRRLLDFARQGDRTRSRADLNEIIEDVLMLTRHLIHTSGVQLSLELAKDPPWVSVDTNQMKQVFLNLIHNALQAMPSGGNLEIQTSVRSKDERKWIAVAIKDSGVGIESRNKDRIFEPFFTTKANNGGTGLGLSVTYGIVIDHGGTIEVESSPGKGSVFTVWLPV